MTKERKLRYRPLLLDCPQCMHGYASKRENCCENCVETRLDPMPWSELMTFGRDFVAELMWYGKGSS